MRANGVYIQTGVPEVRIPAPTEKYLGNNNNENIRLSLKHDKRVAGVNNRVTNPVREKRQSYVRFVAISPKTVRGSYATPSESFSDGTADVLRTRRWAQWPRAVRVSDATTRMSVRGATVRDG